MEGWVLLSHSMGAPQGLHHPQNGNHPQEQVTETTIVGSAWGTAGVLRAALLRGDGCSLQSLWKVGVGMIPHEEEA